MSDRPGNYVAEHSVVGHLLADHGVFGDDYLLMIFPGRPIMWLCARRYDTEEPVAIEIVDSRVYRIDSLSDPGGTPPAQLPWVAPGFVDLQVNGYGGQEFNDLDLDVDKVVDISRRLDPLGVTGYCPTATTHSFRLLTHTLSTVARACDQSPDAARRIVGIHLEGPYLSAEDGPRGAHPREHCRPPDWDEFQRLHAAAQGRIRILTMSPEYPGSAEFIARVVKLGVLVAIGHTAATSDQIRAAVDGGARLSTHLGNGAHGQIRRHPNYIWDQLAEDRLTASLIVDGHHLPPAVVKSFVRAKTADRSILISDLTGLAGMPPGRYENSSLGAVEVLDDCRLVVAGQRQYLAGAALPIGVGVANVRRFAGLSLKAAVDMASTRPAELVAGECGALRVGAPANLIVFELTESSPGVESLTIRATINSGQLVWGSV